MCKTLQLQVEKLLVKKEMIFQGGFLQSVSTFSFLDLPEDIVSSAVFPPFTLWYFPLFPPSDLLSIIYFPVFSSLGFPPFPSPMGSHLLNCSSHLLYSCFHCLMMVRCIFDIAAGVGSIFSHFLAVPLQRVFRKILCSFSLEVTGNVLVLDPWRIRQKYLITQRCSTCIDNIVFKTGTIRSDKTLGEIKRFPVIKIRPWHSQGNVSGVNVNAVIGNTLLATDRSSETQSSVGLWNNISAENSCQWSG